MEVATREWALEVVIREVDAREVEVRVATRADSAEVKSVDSAAAAPSETKTLLQECLSRSCH